jgi:hypothetical protein
VCLIAGSADVASATPLLVPVHADAVSDFEVDDPRAKLDDFANRLVPGNNWQGQAKCAVMDVPISSAHPTRTNPDDDLAGDRAWIGKRFEFPVRIVFRDNGCSHGVLPDPLRVEKATMV